MNEAQSYCRHCSRVTWQTLPDYVCRDCRNSNSATDGEGAILGLALTLTAVLLPVIAIAFLAINALTLIPTLILQPWGLVGSVLLVRWLWHRDNLAAESKRIRYGVSAFLVIFIGLLIVAITAQIFHLQILRTAKELLLVTLPGFGLGILAGRWAGRSTQLWPGFVGIGLAHTLGKATILGWLFGPF